MPGRGGAREGAGRKRSGEEARRTTIAFCCTESEAKRLKEIVASKGVSVSAYICERLFDKNLINNIK